jgi:hypothetical protein
MGLFTKKEKKEMPQFPRLPEKPSLPEYKQQIAIPEPFKLDLPDLEPEEFNMPIRRPQMPRPMPQQEMPRMPTNSGSQPLFVKIDKYKAAVKALNEIKEKLSEAEDTLAKLNAIKLRETDEISRWETEISGIKEKLMAIDKNLFEI